MANGGGISERKSQISERLRQGWWGDPHVILKYEIRDLSSGPGRWQGRRHEARRAVMTIAEFQRQIEVIYFERDRRRGVDADFRWFVEEVGELAKALRGKDQEHLASEFADVFAWLATLASITGVELEAAVARYAAGCPKCGGVPCGCREEESGLLRESADSP